MTKYNIAILGCGAIFSRHLAAIKVNAQHYKLVGIYDPLDELKTKYADELNVKAYQSEEEVYGDKDINCIAILTPNNLHYRQAYQAILHNKHVILEKPATFLASELDSLIKFATTQGVGIYAVLQVRLNPAVIIAKQAIEAGLLGNLRSVSLVQRWQRPLSYFSGWRGSEETGGGILREFGIHYLDILQFLVGVPAISKATFFSTKFLTTDVSDTVYGLLDFGHCGGSFEVSIAAEPKNLECSLSLMMEKGFLKLGGKSLDQIIASDFISSDDSQQFELIREEVNQRLTANLADQGASPYHPELYRQIITNPRRFCLAETYNVINMVEAAYRFKQG